MSGLQLPQDGERLVESAEQALFVHGEDGESFQVAGFEECSFHSTDPQQAPLQVGEAAERAAAGSHRDEQSDRRRPGSASGKLRGPR